jgi:hypothetical protein
MEIIITENQKKLLLLSESMKKVGDIIKHMSNVGIETIKTANENFKFDLKILLTFSAAIGGIFGPLNEFVSGSFPHLSEENVLLITLAVIMVIVTEHTGNVKKLLLEIKNRNLQKEFNTTLEVGTDLKNSFLDFVNSLNLTFSKVTVMMSYAFLIPILDILLDLSKDNSTDSIKEIVYRMGLSLGTHFSAIFLREIITKIIERFRKN